MRENNLITDKIPNKKSNFTMNGKNPQTNVPNTDGNKNNIHVISNVKLPKINLQNVGDMTQKEFVSFAMLNYDENPKQ